MLTREVEVFPLQYEIEAIRGHLRDDACESKENKTICTFNEGKVPKLLDCDLGPLIDEPTLEHFYIIRRQAAMPTLFNFSFEPEVNASKLVLHHICRSQLPLLQVQYNSLPISSSIGNGRASTAAKQPACKHVGRRVSTTLTIHPIGDLGILFSHLQLVVHTVTMEMMQKFELSEVQFFTEDAYSQGMSYRNYRCLVIKHHR